MKRLQSVAKVGPVVAYAYVAHVGDGSRFSRAAQVSNYLGFAPRLDYSGTIQWQGHISKRGERLFAGSSGTGGLVDGPLQRRGISAGTLSPPDGNHGAEQKDIDSIDSAPDGGNDVFVIEKQKRV
ncbi:hypothetical protein FACS189483_11290 [Spirochaetia bacterium]|nr:hypothetical protein FACS189483_11290 [Spirochaetia bacterium]